MKWQTVKLEDVFNFQKKAKTKAGDGLPTGKYQFFTSSNIQRKFLDTFHFNGDCLIIGTGGTASIHYCALPFAVSTDCFVMKTNTPKNVLTKFIYYYLYGNIQILEMGFKGAGLKHISKEYISQITLPLPPLNIQKKIADILDKADQLRRKDQELIKKYDELAQSIFIDMFGDPITNSKSWELKEIKYIGKVQTGNTPSRSIAGYYGSYIEWIKTDNIKLEKIYPEMALEYLSESGLSKGRFVEKDSILVTCIAGSAATIGNIVLTDRRVTFNQQINSLTPNNNFDPLFIYALFRSIKPLIQTSTTKGMKRIIKKSTFEQIKVIAPPYPLQTKFSIRYAKCIKTIEILKGQALKSEHLFQSLLQRAFNGELVR